MLPGQPARMLGAMTTAFIVEAYAPGGSADEFERDTADVVAAIDRLGGATPIELVQAAYVPADQSAFWIVLAESLCLVTDAWQAAGVANQRVLPAVVVAPHPIGRGDAG